jgi:Fungal N-terminal domain of STAND proteins
MQACKSLYSSAHRSSSNFSFLVSRKSSVTTEGLEIYRNLIKTATDDLEARLQSIDEKLETIYGHTVTESGLDATELRLIKEERMSTQKCLQICAQLSDHISQIQLTPRRSGSSSGSMDPDALPERLTIEGLQECKNSLALTVAKLEGYMKDLIYRLVAKSKTAMASEEELEDLVRLREEWETARQCIGICSKADIRLKENISTIDNYATGDAVQFMVSTDGKIIHGKNRGLGWRTRQVGGHLSDFSLQQLSRDMSSIRLENTGNEVPSLRSNTLSVPDDGVENKPNSEFGERYGPGFKLTSRTTPDTPMPSTGPAEVRLSSPPKR